MRGPQLRRAVCREAAELSGPPAGRRGCGRWTGRAARFPAVGWWPRGPRGPPARLRVQPCVLAAGPVTRILSLTEFRDSPCVTVFWACGGSSSVTEQAGATGSGLRAAAGSLAVAGTPLRATIPVAHGRGGPAGGGLPRDGPLWVPALPPTWERPLQHWRTWGGGSTQDRDAQGSSAGGGKGRLPRSRPPLPPSAPPLRLPQPPPLRQVLHKLFSCTSDTSQDKF